MPSSPPASTSSAGKTRDQDVEERDNGTDDALKDGSDAVNNGHEAGADSAEHAGNLVKLDTNFIRVGSTIRTDARYDGSHFVKRCTTVC